MTQSIKDSFLDLERHRQLLEENIEKLRKSLKHWQTWEAEYEGLKEEILSIKPAPTQAQLITIAREYEGELVTSKEVEELLGVNVSRSSTQVVNLLDRRLDYVQQNVQTVQKQLDSAEDKLAAATVISDPSVMNEEGLPIMEISEELDEEGNVISGNVSAPGSTKPQLLEVLEKAGVNIPGGVGNTDVSQATSPSVTSSINQQTAATVPGVRDSTLIRDEKIVEAPAVSTKKAVAFTEDTKEGPSDMDSKSYTAQRLEAIMAQAQADAEPRAEPPVIPEDESVEDAVLRRQMIQYGMSEIGSVVAELDLEEGEESDWTGSNEDWDEDSGDEDRYGRSTGKLVDDELRAKMVELEKKLGIRAMENVGKNPSPEDMDIVQEGIGRITIRKEEDPTKSNEESDQNVQNPSGKAGKKSVQFATELDIAPSQPKTSVPSSVTKSETSERKTAPVNDIVERAPSSKPAVVPTPTPQPPKKQSRFKSSVNSAVSSSSPFVTPTSNTGFVGGPLADPTSGLSIKPARPTQSRPFSQPIPANFQSSATDNPRTVPTGPENAILASTIVERDPPSQVNVAEPDEFDPQLLNQEVATEYHKMRNKFIGKAGGFMKEPESETAPLAEEEGGPKKVSRFKAARLGL